MALLGVGLRANFPVTTDGTLTKGRKKMAGKKPPMMPGMAPPFGAPAGPKPKGPAMGPMKPMKPKGPAKPKVAKRPSKPNPFAGY